MKKITTLFLGIALLVGQPASAQFTPVDAPRAPVDGDLLSYRGYVGNPGPYWGTFGPYDSPTTPQFSIYCVDKLHYVTTGSATNPWTIDATSLGSGSGDMGQTRLGLRGYGDSDALTRYRQTAYLASLFASRPTTDWAKIQNTIWYITASGSTYDATLLAEAQAAEGRGWNSRNWFVMTDQASAYDANGADLAPGWDSRQEYLVHVTPEPATFILLLSGLGFLGVAARRRSNGVEELD